MRYIINQSIGMLGLLMMAFSYQQKTQKRILFFQLMANLCFTLHMLLIDAYVGALMNFISAFRALIYSRADQKWAASKIWVVVFWFMFIGSGLYFWENFFSVLPVTAAVITTISLRIKNPKYVRFITLPTIPMWLVYNFVNGSISGMLSDSFVTVSVLIAIFRYDIKLDFFKIKKESNQEI